jgi:hypothetical protein
MTINVLKFFDEWQILYETELLKSALSYFQKTGGVSGAG